MKTICVVTGARAEYGLLYWLIKEIKDNPRNKLQLIVTGMHLSPEFGLTYKGIEKDGFKITKKIEILLSSDSPIGLAKSMGLGLISFSETFTELTPDIVVILGDRFEALAATSAAMLCRIPIAHFHGGEATEGVIDEAIRHSITKMSHLHFTSTTEYEKRIIQLGEHQKTVFNIGALGIENIRKLKLLKKDELQKLLKFKFNKKNLLVTFHPVTLEKATAQGQFKELLKAIDTLENTNLIFTKPNADTDGRILIKLIDQYVKNNEGKSIMFSSMGQLKYLSTLQFIDAIVGNSSSGIIEAPSFNIGTINLGDRQKGRIKAKSVIDCNPNAESIQLAFNKLYSKPFQNLLKTVKNPYDKGESSKKALKIINKFNLKNILKKEFFDIKYRI